DRAGGRLGQQRLRLGDVEGLPGEGRDDRPCRVEGRVPLAELAVFVPDAQEPAVVRGLPVAAGALTLLDDLLDGGVRRFQAGDGDLLWSPEHLWSGLGARLAHEQTPPTEAAAQAAQAVQVSAAEVPDGGKHLRAAPALL